MMAPVRLGAIRFSAGSAVDHRSPGWSDYRIISLAQQVSTQRSVTSARPLSPAAWTRSQVLTGAARLSDQSTTESEIRHTLAARPASRPEGLPPGQRATTRRAWPRPREQSSAHGRHSGYARARSSESPCGAGRRGRTARHPDQEASRSASTQTTRGAVRGAGRSAGSSRSSRPALTITDAPGRRDGTKRHANLTRRNAAPRALAGQSATGRKASRPNVA